MSDYVVELYYADPKDLESILLKDNIVINEYGVGYRDPFKDPRKSFILNQKLYDGYIRMTKMGCKTTVWSEYIPSKTLLKMAAKYMVGIGLTISTELGDVNIDCDMFGKNIVIFKIECCYI